MYSSMYSPDTLLDTLLADTLLLDTLLDTLLADERENQCLFDCLTGLSGAHWD